MPLPKVNACAKFLCQPQISVAYTVLGLPKDCTNRLTHSLPSTIGVPLGVVTANATDSGPLSSRISASLPAISSSASSQPTRTQPGSAASLGFVRFSGCSSRFGLATSSGIALPFAHSAPPLGCPSSGSTASRRSRSTTETEPQCDLQSVQYPGTR